MKTFLFTGGGGKSVKAGTTRKATEAPKNRGLLAGIRMRVGNLVRRITGRK